MSTLPSALIVDDNEGDRYLLRRMLRRGKIAKEIFEVLNGEEALAFFANRVAQEERHPGLFPPCVVFLDINMPKVNGFEFLERYSKLCDAEGYGSIVFMMFSSSERDEERSRALSYACVKGFISKMPKSSDILREKLSDAGAFKSVENSALKQAC